MYEPFFAALNRLPRLTPLRFTRLLAHFENNAEAIWRANIAEWLVAGIERDVVEELFLAKQSIDPDVTFAALTRLGARVIAITSGEYPSMLRETYAPPPVLLVRGTFPAASDAFAVAVVGSRVTSSYGRQATTELTRAIARAGATVVSGLATGVDALAHAAACDVGGRTIGVLGCGIDIIYPPQNRQLAETILARGGAIISEYPMGTEPTQYNFPQRNRIIAGLARGVLVTEAREKSGSLITATLALEAGREVLAVPGSIYSTSSAGTNALIKAGARVVTSADDVLDALALRGVASHVEVSEVVADSDAEATLLRTLTREPQHADELTRASNLTTSEVGATLSLLEMKGRAKNVGGNQWVRL